MILTFTDIISEEEHKTILEKLQDAEFVDGKRTAGWAAAKVKNNEQLAGKSPVRKEVTDIILKALRRHDKFRAAVQPKQLHSLLISRYQTEMTYGSHVDNALMGDQQLWRSDVSMTLFLNNPEDYEGGELAMESGSGELRFKLKARSMICYPSTTLHRVMPVTRGQRLVAVAWIHSLVRDPAAREILYDIDTARRAVFDKNGKSREFDLLAKTHVNLLRRWAEP